MQIEIEGPEPSFNRPKLIIEFESLDEIRSLWHRLNLSSRSIKNDCRNQRVDFPVNEEQFSTQLWKRIDSLIRDYPGGKRL